MAYTCDNHEEGPRSAFVIITRLNDGETITPCEECLTLWCIGYIQARAELEAAAAAESTAPVQVGATARNAGAAWNEAPETAEVAQEDEGAAQGPPRPKSGRTRRQAAPTAPEEGSETDPALQGAEHDG